MKKKGNLFKLVKSMSQTEKRYFKLFCGLQKENSNHLRLFEALDSMEAHDDDLLKLRLSNESFLSHLAVTKNYLQGLILKSLRNYHEAASKDTEIANLILNTEILFDKELFDLCHINLLKAESLALKAENFSGLVSIYEWQRRLYVAQYGPNDVNFKNTVKKQAEVIDKIKTINGYWNLIAEVSNFEYQADEARDISQHPLIIAYSPDSLLASILHNHVHYSHDVLKYRDNAMAETYLDNIISLLEQHPDRVKEEPGQYATALGNKVSFLLFQKRWEEAIDLLGKVRDIPEAYKLKKKSKFSIRTTCRSYNLELELYRDRKDTKAGLVLIQEICTYMDENISAIPEDYFILFWNQFANIYFMSGKYSNALVWVNKIIDNKPKSNREIVSYTRILHLIIHFEMGNLVFLKYAIDSHRRYFKKNRRQGLFETCCLSFFSKLTSVSSDMYYEEFERFYAQLFDDEQKILSESILDYLDIKSWLETKLAN